MHVKRDPLQTKSLAILPNKAQLSYRLMGKLLLLPAMLRNVLFLFLLLFLLPYLRSCKAE